MQEIKPEHIKKFRRLAKEMDKLMREVSDIDLLGMDRMVNRAFESATARDKTVIEKWHRAELDAAKRKANEEKAQQFGYKHAACLCCGNHDTNVCETC